MEYKNSLYEIIKPVRENKIKTYKLRKGLIALGIVIAFFSVVGVVANANGYINLPFEFNKLIIPANHNSVYPWINHSIPITLINPNLINPSFSAGGFKIGYN